MKTQPASERTQLAIFRDMALGILVLSVPLFELARLFNSMLPVLVIVATLAILARAARKSFAARSTRTPARES